MTDDDEVPELEAAHDTLLEMSVQIARQWETKYERRLAREALAAWRAGYEYLLSIKGGQVPTRPGDDGYTLERKVAFVPYHVEPERRDLPDGYEYELIPLDVLDDPDARDELKSELNNDHD